MKSIHISRISIAVLGAMVAFNAGAVTLLETVTGGTVNGDPSVQIGSSTSSLRLAINSVTPGAGVVIDTAGGGILMCMRLGMQCKSHMTERMVI